MPYGIWEQGFLASSQAPCPQVPAQLSWLNLHRGLKAVFKASSPLHFASGGVRRCRFALFLASSPWGLGSPVVLQDCVTPSVAWGLRRVPFPKVTMLPVAGVWPLTAQSTEQPCHVRPHGWIISCRGTSYTGGVAEPGRKKTRAGLCLQESRCPGIREAV